MKIPLANTPPCASLHFFPSRLRLFRGVPLRFDYESTCHAESTNAMFTYACIDFPTMLGKSVQLVEKNHGALRSTSIEYTSFSIRMWEYSEIFITFAGRSGHLGQYKTNLGKGIKKKYDSGVVDREFYTTADNH